MSGAEEKPRSRRGTSGAASRRSSRTGTTSRPSSPSRQLTRLLSGNHLDDHSHYRHHAHDEEAIDDQESSDDIDLEKDERETDEGLSPTSSEDTAEEAYESRDGIEDRRDIESGPRLQKTKSSKSAKTRDPNLVTWDGPDDVQNPKNWAFRRKWAATLIGRLNFNLSYYAFRTCYSFTTCYIFTI
jgi:hypothetical protein